MDIWLIKAGEVLPLGQDGRKMRTALLADKLSERGHRVMWWTSAFDHFKKDWIFPDDREVRIGNNVRILALKGFGYKKNISIARFYDHRQLARKFRKLAPGFKRPDIIVTAMPSYDLAYEAVIYANAIKVPVLVDIRDAWPDIFLDQVPNGLKAVLRLALYGEFRTLKKTLKKADGMISMMNTLLEWGLNHAGRQRTWKDKVFYLGHRENRRPADGGEKLGRLKAELSGKFVVTFIGTFASYHNPSILVDCAKKMAEVKDITFVLAGNGEFLEGVRRKSEGMPNVKLPGWLSQSEISELLSRSSVGICTTARKAEFFPNKAFAYLSAGLPVISAFDGDLKEVLEEYGIGFSYPPNDAEALAGCVRRLYEDKALYKRMSEKALKVFKEQFDASKIYESYSEHIEQVASTQEKEEGVRGYKERIRKRVS
ncbi:MAG: glycosyltransferase family 4 protein [Deltaproteobacteria bacterium]|nr:glycosyltransferase family 4 protein [Deltaproteobacteria bacterium]